MSKEKQRKIARNIRNAMTELEVDKRSQLLCNNLLTIDRLLQADVVMGYLPFQNEVDILPLMHKLEEMGKTVAVSITEPDRIYPVVYHAQSQLEKDRFGVRYPVDKTAIDSKTIDVCLVPGVAFSKTGKRLGFGKGYYDRFLKELPCLRIGISYERQLIEDLATDEHDEMMHLIVTPDRVIQIGE